MVSLHKCIQAATEINVNTACFVEIRNLVLFVCTVCSFINELNLKADTPLSAAAVAAAL